MFLCNRFPGKLVSVEAQPVADWEVRGSHILGGHLGGRSPAFLGQLIRPSLPKQSPCSGKMFQSRLEQILNRPGSFF